MRKYFATAALAALVASPVGAATITNVPAWDAATFIFTFGAPDTTHYGQTFTSPGGNLSSLTFQLGVPGTAGNFRIDVSPWDGNAVTGAPLWSSADIAYTGAGAYGATLDLATTPGSLYIAYLTVAGVASPIQATPVGGTLTDTIPLGEFRFLNSNGAAPGVGQVWDSWFIPDMAFTAEFSSAAVPTPASIALLLGGLALMRLSRRASTPR